MSDGVFCSAVRGLTASRVFTVSASCRSSCAAGGAALAGFLGVASAFPTLFRWHPRRLAARGPCTDPSRSPGRTGPPTPRLTLSTVFVACARTQFSSVTRSKCSSLRTAASIGPAIPARARARGEPTQVQREAVSRTCSRPPPKLIEFRSACASLGAGSQGSDGSGAGIGAAVRPRRARHAARA